MAGGERYRCYVKATDREAGSPRYSASWATARRAQLVAYEDRLECGDWTIRASDVEEAVLYEARTLLIVPVFVLVVSLSDRVYQFGMNPWCKMKDHLPFEARHERTSLGYSKVSLVVRLLLLGYLAYWAYQRWFAG